MWSCPKKGVERKTLSENTKIPSVLKSVYFVAFVIYIQLYTTPRNTCPDVIELNFFQGFHAEDSVLPPHSPFNCQNSNLLNTFDLIKHVCFYHVA